MIRLLRAFAWLRWRLLLNALRGTGRRDSLERVSRVLSAILPIVLVALFVPAMIGTGVVGFMGGWGMGTGRIEARVVIALLRLLLAIFTVGLVIAPAVRSARGMSTGLSRFILLPIPAGFLFLSDAMLGLFDPWFMILIPMLTMFSVGLAVAGRFGLAAVALLGGLVFLVLLLALQTTIANVLSLIYRNRRRGEAATILILFALSLLGVIPLLSGNWGSPRSRTDRAAKAETRVPPASPGVPGTGPPADAPPSRQQDASPGGSASSRTSIPLGDGFGGVLVPLRVLPSELYGRALALTSAGRLAPAVGKLGLLAALAGALLAISWVTHGRLLSTPSISGRFGKGTRSRALALQLPGLSSSASAVAVASVKVVLRSVTGKMAIYFSPLSMVMLVFVLTRLGRSRLDQLGPYIGPILLGSAAYFCLVTVSRFMLNQFAIDGAGFTLQLLSPLSGRQMVIGKMVGMGFLYALPCGVYFLAALIFTPHAPVLLWAAVVVSVVGYYVLFAPITSILAASFPRRSDLSRIGESSKPGTMASLSGFAIGGICVMPFTAVCVGALGIWNSPLLALVLACVCACGAFGLSTQLVMTAARVLDSRRENLGLVAQGR